MLVLRAPPARATAETIVLSARSFHDWEKSVRRLPSSEAEPEWYRLAVAASDGSFRLSLEEAARVRREAIARLTPRSLVELAARGSSLELSEAYVRARLERGDGPEAAAECRDAIWRHGEAAARGLVSLQRRSGRAADTAGGVGASIAHVLVVRLGESESDAGTQRVAIGRGLRAGLGERADRTVVEFVVAQTEFDGTVSPVHAARAARDAVGRGAGVIVLAAADAALEGAMIAECHREGLVLLASRAVTPFKRTRAPEERATRAWLYRLDPDPDLRARRVLQAAVAAGVRRLAVAVPAGEQGRSEFADAVLDNALRLGLGPVRLDYEPGRRNYRPEADRFSAMGADAILLAGPGEESGDWVRALAGLRRAPKVFGDEELDPAAFHESVRPLLEGAVYVADYWQPKDSTSAVRDDARSGRGVPLIDLELAGRYLGQAMAAGALSPGDLVKRFGDCAQQACPLSPPDGIAAPPLFRIRNGRAEPLP